MQLDIYETIGVALPGSVVVITAMMLFPEVKGLVGTNGVELGGLGVFLVASFVMGHIVAALGNLIEWLETKVWASPSDLLLSPEQKVIAPSQRERLAAAIRETLGVDFQTLDANSWRAVRREMYAHVAAANATDRIEKFNRTYGLQRGIASACLVSAAMIFFQAPTSHVLIAALILASLASLFRMRRFASHYSREIVVEFLRLKGARGA